MQFLNNSWYAAALAEEVGRNLMRRTILEQPVLLYRKENGDPVAVFDRCPHRFAPLSLGDLIGDVVQCKYHGLRFGADGSCVVNPHSDTIAPTMCVRAYPLIERHGVVWIWMGTPALADADTIPNMTHVDKTDTLRTATFYEKGAFRYDILIDNLLDVSHVDYLHVGSFSGGPPQAAATEMFSDGDTVVVVRTHYRAPPLAGYPEFGEVDLEIRTRWHPSQVLMFEIRIAPAGRPISEGRLTSQFTHAVTPETVGTTHYFLLHSWDAAMSDEAFEQRKVQQRELITTEDMPMLEAVDREMAGADLMALRPVILPVDKGAVLVRRKMKQLLKDDQGPMA